MIFEICLNFEGSFGCNKVAIYLKKALNHIFLDSFIFLLGMRKSDMQTTNRKFFLDDDIQQDEIIKAKNVSLLINKLSLICLTTFYFGYSLVYISVLSDSTLVNIYGQSMQKPVTKGFLIGCLTIGAMFGSLLSMFIIPLASRRKLLLVLCILSLIIEGTIQVQQIVAIFVCRSLQGIMVGLFMALVPTYIGELAPKELAKKGIFGVFATLFVIMGVMFAFSLGIILVKSGLQQTIRWRILFGVNFISVLITTICVLLEIIPESPNSLIQMGREDEARGVIALFHRKKYVDEVYREKVNEMEKHQTEERKIKDSTTLRTFLAFQIPMMQQLTGINAFVSQMGYVVTSYNVGFGQFVPVIMGIVQFIAAIYSMSCLAKTRRRTMILVGNFGMGLCALGIGILFEFTTQFAGGFWIVVLLTFIYMTIHGGTLIPAVWMYVPEISPGRQPQFSSITNWLMCSVTIVVFPIVNLNYGYGPMFLTFGIISLALFLMNYFIMIESKPRTVQEVNVELRSS